MSIANWSQGFALSTLASSGVLIDKEYIGAWSLNFPRSPGKAEIATTLKLPENALRSLGLLAFFLSFLRPTIPLRSLLTKQSVTQRCTYFGKKNKYETLAFEARISSALRAVFSFSTAAFIWFYKQHQL